MTTDPKFEDISLSEQLDELMRDVTAEVTRDTPVKSVDCDFGEVERRIALAMGVPMALMPSNAENIWEKVVIDSTIWDAKPIVDPYEDAPRQVDVPDPYLMKLASMEADVFRRLYLCEFEPTPEPDPHPKGTPMYQHRNRPSNEHPRRPRRR